MAYFYEALSEKQGVAQDSFGKCVHSRGLACEQTLHLLAWTAAVLRALTALAAALVLTEAKKENVFHATKDTSGAGQGDQPQGLSSSPTTQAFFEEPQPSTSTSDLFSTTFASSMEPPAGRVPASSPGEMGILGGGSNRFCLLILADVVLR